MSTILYTNLLIKINHVYPIVVTIFYTMGSIDQAINKTSPMNIQIFVTTILP